VSERLRGGKKNEIITKNKRGKRKKKMNKKKKKTEQRKNETKNSVRSVSYGTSD
jgi:hypothetical protein